MPDRDPIPRLKCEMVPADANAGGPLKGDFERIARQRFQNSTPYRGSASTKATEAPVPPRPAPQMREYFVDAVTAAKFLSIEKRTLLKMAREGSVPAHPIGDGTRKLWRFLLSELDEWLRARINSARRPCSPNRRNAQ